MNVYHVIILTLVALVLLHELVPPAQSKIKLALHGARKRVKHLREFIDDDDYNVLNEFSYCPFTMADYLNDQEHLTWCEIKKRARRRQRQGWGSQYFDGPDQLEPLRFWWHRGTIIRREGAVRAYGARRRRRHRHRTNDKRRDAAIAAIESDQKNNPPV